MHTSFLPYGWDLDFSPKEHRLLIGARLSGLDSSCIAYASARRLASMGHLVDGAVWSPKLNSSSLLRSIGADPQPIAILK